MTDVEGDHANGAALQQHVGEAAGRCADVERLAAVDRDAERVERVRQFDAAAADVRVVGLFERNLCISRDRRAGFLRGLAVDQDDARKNERARPLARLGQAALHEQQIEPASQTRGSVIVLLDDPRRHVGQAAVMQARRLKRAQRTLVMFGGERARRVQAVDGWVCRLARFGVFACGFPKLLRVSLDVEDVVHDLERKAQVRPYSSTAPIDSSVPPAMMAPATAAARMSAPVLRACMSCSDCW